MRLGKSSAWTPDLCPAGQVLAQLVAGCLARQSCYTRRSLLCPSRGEATMALRKLRKCFQLFQAVRKNKRGEKSRVGCRQLSSSRPTIKPLLASVYQLIRAQRTPSRGRERIAGAKLGSDRRTNREFHRHEKRRGRWWAAALKTELTQPKSFLARHSRNPLTKYEICETRETTDACPGASSLEMTDVGSFVSVRVWKRNVEKKGEGEEKEDSKG